MTRIHSLLLSVLKVSIQDQKTTDPGIDPNEWDELINLAKQQEILSLILNSIYNCSSYKKIDRTHRNEYRDHAVSLLSRQIIQTNEFLTLILHAKEQGMDPVVLKGVICRELYPQPCLRPSVDDDILVTQEEAAAFHRVLLSAGLFSDDPDADPETDPELSYHKENSPIYIEMGKTLFPPEDDVFGDFNRLFPGIREHTVRVQIEDVSVRTLSPTDHLLYLFIHAFKHFVLSGIGIRPVCDIGLFAEHHAKDTDWAHIRSCLEEVHAFDFARALFHIVQQYLLPDAGFYAYIRDWKISGTDTDDILADILAGGVHGNISLGRLHSGNITLNAVTREKKTGSSGSPGLIRIAFQTVFLPVKPMSARYPYLKKAPYLLPFAWVQRTCRYVKERITAGPGSRDSASESLRLGRSRVELLKKYGIIR